MPALTRRFAKASALLFVLALGVGWHYWREWRERFEEEGESEQEEYRAESWFEFQRSYPFDSYPDDARRKARESYSEKGFDLLNAEAQLWRSLGPTATYPRYSISGLESGRIDAIAISPANPQIVLVGGNTGGIWRSTDGGNSFLPVSDNQLDLAVGSIAFSASDPSIVYAGMGSGVGYLGTGVLKSRDAGLTWTRVNNGTLPAPGSSVKVIVDPRDPNRVYVAQYSYRLNGVNFSSGLWISTDGGVDWTRRFRGLPRDLVQSPNNPQILYLSLVRVDEPGSLPAGLYQSTDSGLTWSRIFASPYTSITDIRVAVSAADRQVIYIYTGGTADNVSDIRLVTSNDAGATWSSRTLTIDSGQFGSNTYLYAAPNDANTVYIGSRDVYKSTDAGATWTNLTSSFSLTGGIYSFSPAQAKVHADQRGFTFSPNNPSLIYLGSDGGLWKSSDAGNTFASLNATLSLTQFYSIAVSPTDSSAIYGGTQDNGWQVRLNGSQIWKELVTGDVGAIVVNPKDTSIVFTVDDSEISRYRNQGRSFDKKVGSKSTFGESTNNARIAFLPPLASTGADSKLYFGTWRLFVSSDLGETWTAPGGKQDLTKGGRDTITAIGVGPASANLIYTGSSQGRVMVSPDAGATWNDVSVSPIPNRFIKSIVVDPADSSVAYLSVSGFASGHVFKTINAGQGWTDISGDLPDIPVNALLTDPANSGALYAGTDIGVFRSLNLGLNWAPFNSGMPPVIVNALAGSPDGRIRAATYGRGIYEFGSGAFETTLSPGQVMSSTTPGRGELSVGYAQLAGSLTQPAALANFGFTENGVLVTEAGIPASTAVKNARLFVDFNGSTNSGVALANPNAGPITVNTELRGINGALVARSSLKLDGLGHVARFVDQMFTRVPNPFLGTLTLSSVSSFIAVNLSSAQNGHGEILFNALPIADLDAALRATSLVFPQIVGGGGIATQLLLMNPSSTNASSGSLSMFDENGAPMTLDFGAPTGQQNTLSYSLAPNGMVKYATPGAGHLKVGYAVLTVGSGPTPVGSGIFSVSAGGGLTSQAGVPSAPQTTSARMFVEVSSVPLFRNTGIAIVNRNNQAANVSLNLIGIDGGTRAATLRLPPNGHVAKFINELFSGLPADLQGVLTLTSDVPLSPLTLRLTINQRSEPIFSTLPVADLKNPPAGPLFIPQVVDGAGYQTQFILINTSAARVTVRIDLFDERGIKVTLR